jgi:hypothetical protein
MVDLNFKIVTSDARKAILIEEPFLPKAKEKTILI